MSDNTVKFTINLDGNAYSGICQIDKALGKVLVDAKSTKSMFDKLKNFAFHFDIITNAVSKLSEGINSAIGVT